MEIDPWLLEILPFGYKYIVNEFVKNNEMLAATIRVNIFCEADALQWLSQFENTSKFNFRVSRSATPADKILFKKDYHCHHNTRATYISSKTKIPSSKHTNCPAFLRITVKNPKMKRSKDIHLKTHPCEIQLKNNHNHSLDSTDVLRHRRPNKNTVEKVLLLYQMGHFPSAALKLLKCDLQQQYGSDYLTYAADGALCPSLQWMYHFYYTTFKRRCRKSTFQGKKIKVPHLQKSAKVVTPAENNQNITVEEALNDGMDICDPVEYEDISENQTLVEDKENNNVEERLSNVIDVLKNYLGDTEILNAVGTFLDNFEKIETKEELVSSLTMFGISC